MTEEEKARKCRVVGAIYILLHVNNLPACVDIFRKGIVQPECIFFNVFNAFLKVFWMTEKVMALFRLLLFFFIDVTKL